jgi:hypothetical protein
MNKQRKILRTALAFEIIWMHFDHNQVGLRVERIDQIVEADALLLKSLRSP